MKLKVSVFTFLFTFAASFLAAQNLNPLGGYENQGKISYYPIDVKQDTIFWPMGKKGLLVFNAQNPENLERIKLYKNYEERSYRKVYGSSEFIRVHEDRAYLANGALGFEVLDISEPVNPVIKGKYYRNQAVSSFLLHGTHAILGLTNNGVEVVDISNLNDIPMVSRKNMEGIHVNNIQVYENYVFASCGKEGLRIIPFSQPLEEFKSGGFIREYYPPGKANDLIVFGGKALLANGKTEVLMLDLTLPEHPSILESLSTEGKTNDLHLEDGYLYVATEKGIEIFSAESPDNIFHVSSFYDNERAYHEITVEGRYLYATYKKRGLFKKSYGLRIFEIQ